MIPKTEKGPDWDPLLTVVARLTGLEPATPGVTGRYSNQLSYNRPLCRSNLGDEALECHMGEAIGRQAANQPDSQKNSLFGVL